MSEDSCNLLIHTNLYPKLYTHPPLPFFSTCRHLPLNNYSATQTPNANEMNNTPNEHATRKLYELYRDPESHLFLQSDTKKIFEAAKNDAKIYPVTRKEILDFKASIESASRDFERRTLRSRVRYTAHRRWISYSPLSILLGMNYQSKEKRANRPTNLFFCELFFCTLFARRLMFPAFYSEEKWRQICDTDINGLFQVIQTDINVHLEPIPQLLFLMSKLFHVSRLCHLSLLKNATSTEVCNAFEKALVFFGASNFQSYKKFACDRGYDS